MKTMEQITRDFTDRVFDRADDMQKEMHIMIKTIMEADRGKGITYEDAKTVYLLYKISQVNEYIDNFSATFNKI